MVYVIQVCRQQAGSKPVWHIPLLRVQWKTPDDGRRNCPKRVEFNSKNKFEKLVHLVGFIIRIYHDARSHERLFFFLICKHTQAEHSACIWSAVYLILSYNSLKPYICFCSARKHFFCVPSHRDLAVLKRNMCHSLQAVTSAPPSYQ